MRRAGPDGGDMTDDVAIKTEDEVDELLGDEPAAREPVARPRPAWRQVAAWVLTTLAVTLLLFALLVPNNLNRLSLGAFVRVPIEAIVALGLVLVLPRRC